MPKRLVSLKSTSKTSTRRASQSYSAAAGNCNAVHLSIPFPSSSSPTLPSMSIPQSTHQVDPLESSARFSPPISSSSSSSSSPTSCSFASLSVTCLEVETPEGLGSSTSRQAPENDVLYEYVKGLQEANNALDMDVAERVMQELAESMTSPLAAAMVVSSGGAHLIASAVKQFKGHGLQRTNISKGKVSKVGVNCASASKPTAGDKVELKVPLQETAQSCCTSITSEPLHQQANGDGIHLSTTIKDAKIDDVQQPHAVPACNEARRKRQRTSDETFEFDDHKGDCHCKGRSEMYAVTSITSESKVEKQLPIDAYLWRSASEFPSLCSSIHRDLGDCTGSSEGEAKCSKWVELVKNKTDQPTLNDLDCSSVLEKEAISGKGEEVSLVHAGSSQIDTDDVLISLSKKFGEVSRTLLEAMVDEVCDSQTSSCKSAELEATIMSRLQGMVTASVQSLPLGSTTQCKVLFTKQRDLANNTKRSPKVRCSSSREKTKGTSCLAVKVQKSTGPGESNEQLKSQKSQSSNCENFCNTSRPAELQPCSRQHTVADKASEESQETMAALESRLRITKAVDCKEEETLRNDLSSCRITGDGASQEARKVAFPSVLKLAKEAGLPDVVATACHALDKLINAALQGKGVGSSGITASQLSGRRRGKVLPAELYVALTEALVEVVQVLKDQVDLLCWCLDCLGSILPPTSWNRAAHDGFVSSACSALDSFFSSKELLHPNGCKGRKAESGAAGRQASCEQNDSGPAKRSASAGAGRVEMSFRSMPKSLSGALSSDAHLTGDNSSKTVIGSSLCSSISSGSAASSLSALAAVAYTATVPMLAEKAVKAILSAIQPCDIEPQSTQAALHALSAHLSSTNSKYVCDDVITFIIAAMREFKYDAEMQTESCITLSALNRAISSATGHCAWSTILDNMNTHHTNVVMQRAGCSALHVLCTRAGLGVLEWGGGKRPERAGKDSDREAGVEVLVSAMLSFPDDVRIQWHGCSALWTLVDSAGTRSVVNMVDSGALRAVTGAMCVCRTNEIMQQEGCNMIGTMARLLVEGGYGFGSQPIVQVSELQTLHKADRHVDDNKCFKGIERHGDDLKILNKTKVHEARRQGQRLLGLSEEWWEALKVVVAAMRSFKKSKSVQSNGTFALGCILKGAMESIYMGSMPSSLASSDSCVHRDEWQKKSVYPLRACREQLGCRQNESNAFERGALEDIEQLNEAVEATMVAMPEFPKVETIQVWGCAVLQQVFIAYVHYSKHIMLLSSTGSPFCGSSQGGNSRKAMKQAVSGCDSSSHSSVLAKLVLSQATSTMFMISGMMALSYNGPAGNADQRVFEKPSGYSDSRMLTKLGTCKSMGLRPQSTQANQALTSVRQSWCAALGAIGDVFGHLTQSTEISVGKNLPKIANGFDIMAASTEFTETMSKEAPFESGKVAPLTAIKIPLDPEPYDRKAGASAGDCSTPSYILPNSQGAKLKYFTLGTNSPVNLPSCKPVRAEDNSCKTNPGKRSSRALSKSVANEQLLLNSDWSQKDDFSQQQVINDIKAWQEATESLAKIAEMVGFPMSVKNAILAIRTILYKLEDAETVIWACHALVGLYLTWENVHLFKPGLECDREEFKGKIWGEGDVGVRQLVYLVSHWTKQNRMDVVSLALQALYRACVFAATVREIEEVFTPSDCGIEAVLGAILKVLGSGGSLAQRKKVVQQACCVLTEVCGYSIPAQIAFAAAGGAEIIFAAMERFDEDNEVVLNGLHALGLDSRSQTDFNVLWNAALHRNNLGSGGKKGSKKKGAAYSFVSFSLVFKEGTSAACSTLVPTDGKAVIEDMPYESEHRGFRISPQLEQLMFDESSQIGRFVTWLIVGPGCGGPTFCVEVLRRLNLLSPKHLEMQSHVCLVIGHMSLCNLKWCQEFLDSGGLEAVLACMEGFGFSRAEKLLSLPVCIDGVEETLQLDLPQHDMRSAVGKTKTLPRPKHINSDECGGASAEKSHLHYSACIALTGIMRDQKAVNPLSLNVVIKALVLALHQYGGLSHLSLYTARLQNVQSEVCAAARLALARLGVSRVGDSQSKQLAHEAAEVGDLISLEALRKKHVDIMALDGLGRTPLWYAEQSCHFKVVEYLKEQEELVGKRRAREKSKSKVRCSSSKGDPRSNKAKSTFEEVCSLDASQQELELPQMVAAEDPEMKLQFLQERNFHLTHSGLAEQSAKEASNTSFAKENFICDADRCMPCVVGQETEISSGSLKKGHDFMLLASLPSTKEVSTSEAERNATRRKKNKAGKKSQASHELSEQDTAVKSGLQSPLADPESLVNDFRTHAGEQALGAPNKESSNEALSHLLGGSEEIKMDVVTCKDLPNLPVLTTGERSLKCMATCESDNSKHVNKLLQEALVSGVVENLEAAIQTCMVPESGADDALLKKVRVALAKRLKRVEKSTQMERELAAAVNERSSRRLVAAIVAIEHVPRFAAALAEKITEARSVLLEIQKEERFVKKDALENVVSDSVVDAASISLECGKEIGYGAKDTLVVQARKVRERKGTESVLGPKKEHSEAQVKENRKGLLKIHTERQLSPTCKREDVDSERLLFQNDLGTNGCPKGRGDGKSLRGFSQPLLKLQDSSAFIELKHERVFPSALLRSSGNTQPKEERPPLLPTPAYAVTALPVDHATRSVIQPPRHEDHPALLLERIPITPQLFPISQGAPFGYSYREVLEGKADVSEGFTSLKDSASEFNELGPSHISQLFPPCSSHQLFSTNSDLYNPWSSGFPEQGASVFQPRPSLTNIESAHLAGDFVPSSTTLFSSAYGESDEFLNSIGFTASNFPGVLPSHHVHSPVHLRASECNGSSLPAFVQQALSCTCDDDDYEQVEPVNSSSSMNSSALCFPELKGSLDDAKQDQSFGSCLEPMFKKKASQLSFFNQDFQHLSQMHLQQSGILDTSLGVSCSVCLDNPKDATLISCGHQLCKGCAEQMHRLHHPCPVCNRMIETVLSLCS